jgi:hypothetical protein
MNGADWALIVVVVIGGVIGWRMGTVGWSAFALGFTFGIAVGAWPATHVGSWVLHQMEGTHSSFYEDVDLSFVTHFCIRMAIAILAGALGHRLARVNREHWQSAFAVPPFPVVSKVVGALNSALVLTIVACELALLLAATMTSVSFDGTVLHSAVLSPTTRLFHLQLL